MTFKDARVPADHLLNDDTVELLAGRNGAGRAIPLLPAISLGIGRAAYETAVEYAGLRVRAAAR